MIRDVLLRLLGFVLMLLGAVTPTTCGALAQYGPDFCRSTASGGMSLSLAITGILLTIILLLTGAGLAIGDDGEVAKADRNFWRDKPSNL